MTEFAVNAVILCDDIRKEVTNKDMLIGVYGGALIVSAFPGAMPMAVWMELMPESVGVLNQILKCTLPLAPLILLCGLRWKCHK